MTEPIPKTTVYKASDGSGTKSVEQWFSKELFSLLARNKPAHINRSDIAVARNVCDLFGQHIDEVITLAERVQLERGQ